MNDATPAPVPNEAMLQRSSLDFPIVGIGASAGGLAPLRELLASVPADSGMAFVAVLHLAPHEVSALPQILQSVTPMPVTALTAPVPIERNCVYVIPPNKLLVMNDGYLSVRDFERTRAGLVTIDLFFRTLAVVHRERALAVVLSGTGSDGSVGLTRIKEEGGVTLVQAPDDADFDGMPRAAIATQTVDWVLPASQLGAKLIEIWANARRIRLPRAAEAGLRGQGDDSPDAEHQGELALRDVLVLLHTRTGHDFRSYKRATVLRRLERRMQVNGLQTLPEYRSFLRDQTAEAPALLQDLLIGVTNFFRDPEAFDVVARDVLPALLQQAMDAPEGLRGWVAGCSSGEEAYSLAMLLSEQAASMPQQPKISLFATDIDEAAIGVARLGVYPGAIETDVSSARLQRFFDAEDDHYRVRKEVREKVMFAAHNILRDPPFSKLHFISCRNLLIYLDRDVHAQVLAMFHFALRPGGYLFLGSSESGDSAPQYFTVVDKKNRIYRTNIVARGPVSVPSLPLSTFRNPPLAAPLARTPKQLVSMADVHRRLAEQHAPPSVLIDADGDIVHLSAQSTRFLHYAAGTPSHHLVSLVQPELRLELRTALLQATNTGNSVEARRVRLIDDGRSRIVTMTVRPVAEPELNLQLTLVLFDEVEDSMAADVRAPGSADPDPVVVQLEQELRRLKEQLQDTAEHSETSTEELKASNEELQAINEELRSTTEELETSKEELQSINEELITVNHELKSKIEETGKINDDLQNLIASTEIATVFVDRDMKIKRFTPQATLLFNLIPSDIGRSLLDITHRLAHGSLAEDAAEAFRSLRVNEREVRGQDGRWYLARVLPYRTMEDRIDGAVLTFVDISARRQAEESMRLVTESTMDYAIVTLDTAALVVTWNKGAERMFGHTEVQAVGQSIAIIFPDDDLADGALDKELHQARSAGRAEEARWHLRRDGSRVFCSGITTPLYDGGVLRGYGKIARDLTGSKRSELEREALAQRQAVDHAETMASSDLKDEFMAVLSHELKNPLNLIQLNAELLARLPETQGLARVVRAAQTIRNAVRSQAQIIDDLLDLSRVNTGKLVLQRATVDWAAALDTIGGAIQAEAETKGVALTIDGHQNALLIDADPVRLEQIVWNLLSNAVKFTPPGGSVQVRIWAEAGSAHLEVRDSGRGIAAEQLPWLFEMYRQGEPGTAARHGGLGIGLALVKELVLAHGGKVRALSDGIDRGATFSVSLPLLGPST